MSFFSSRQYDTAQWNIVVQIVPFPELFYTLLWNPLKHQTTPLIMEHVDPQKYEFADCTICWFWEHKLSMFIYLSMLYSRCSFFQLNYLNSQFKFLPLGVAQFRFKLTLSRILIIVHELINLLCIFFNTLIILDESGY